MDEIIRYYPDAQILRIKHHTYQGAELPYVVTVHFKANGRYNVVLGAGKDFAGAMSSLAEHCKERVLAANQG